MITCLLIVIVALLVMHVVSSTLWRERADRNISIVLERLENIEDAMYFDPTDDPGEDYPVPEAVDTEDNVVPLRRMA